MKCPNCEATKRQVKNGLNPSGSQKYLCTECKTVYTPEPKLNGYPKETKSLAVRMYVEGNSYHAIARILKVNPQSVVNWVRQYTANLPAAPVPSKPRIAELDELYTFIGKKKNEVYVLTVVDRATRCVLSWNVVPERTSEALQACLERAPQAKQYYSDAFPVYDTLYYGAPYELRPDKLETYSVEAVNADLCHYLKRLARCSLCFSRHMKSLMENLRLFVYCYKQRQLAKRRFLKYSFHLVDFVSFPV